MVAFLQNVETSLYRNVSTFLPRLSFVAFLQNVETSVYRDASTFLALLCIHIALILGFLIY